MPVLRSAGGNDSGMGSGGGGMSGGRLNKLNTPIHPYALTFAASLHAHDYMGTQTHPSAHCRISLRSALIEYGLDFEW
jgi:hypothetical protein